MLRLISIIVSDQGYEDVFQMFYNMDTNLTEHIILTKHIPKDLPANLKNTKIITPDETLSGSKFWNWTYEKSKKAIVGNDNKYLLMQWIAGSVASKIKREFGDRVTVGSYLVSAEYTYLTKRYWNSDPNDNNLDWKQKLGYFKFCLKNTIIYYLSIRGCDFIIGNSSLVTKNVTQFHKSIDCHLIEGNPIANESQITSSKSFDNKITKLISVGNLQPPKGIATLLKGFTSLSNENLELNIVGPAREIDKSWKVRIEEKYKYKNVNFVGKLDRESLQAAYRDSDILLFTSFYEGSPRVIIEAMMAGCQVISSDIPGVRAIDPNGNFVNYFEAGNTKSLEEQITKVVNSRNSWDTKETQRTELIEKFYANNMADKFLTLFEKIFP